LFHFLEFFRSTVLRSPPFHLKQLAFMSLSIILAVQLAILPAHLSPVSRDPDLFFRGRHTGAFILVPHVFYNVLNFTCFFIRRYLFNFFPPEPLLLSPVHLPSPYSVVKPFKAVFYRGDFSFFFSDCVVSLHLKYFLLQLLYGFRLEISNMRARLWKFAECPVFFSFFPWSFIRVSFCRLDPPVAIPTPYVLRPWFPIDLCGSSFR